MQGEALCGTRPRFDEIADRLRLQQVQLPVQYGAAGEFSRFCLPCTRLDRCGKYRDGYAKSSVSRDLEEVFSRECGRRDEVRGHHVIEHGAVVRVDDTCAGGLARNSREGPEQASGDGQDIRTRDAHDGECATPWSCSDRGDRLSVPQRTRVECRCRDICHAAVETAGTSIDSPGSMMCTLSRDSW